MIHMQHDQQHQKKHKENSKRTRRVKDCVIRCSFLRLVASFEATGQRRWRYNLWTWILHEFYMELRSYSRLHSCGVKSFSGTAFVCQYMLPNVHVRLKHVETSLHLGTCMYLMSTCNPNSRNWWLPRLVTKLQSKCRGQRKSSVPLWLHSWL